MLVNAIIAGTQKGGTTALFEFLSGHPQIGVPVEDRKELHFFDHDEYFQGPEPSYSFYQEQFLDHSRPVLLEATPVYLFWEPAPARIAAYNPKMRLILMLRDPVSRAYSQWKMEKSRREGIGSFLAEIKQESKATKKGQPQHRVRSYLGRGMYGSQVKRLLEFFPRDQLLFLRTEDLLKRHEETLDSVCDFLELDRFVDHPPMEVIRPAVTMMKFPPLKARERKKLLGAYQSDLKLLTDLTGLNIDNWLI